MLFILFKIKMHMWS